jgi:hypothetical protein
MTQRNKPRDAAVFGIDIGKNTFHVVGLDGTGAPIQRATSRRDTLLQFFERAARSVLGMEACPDSQWLARKLKAFGHTARIVPAKLVKPTLLHLRLLPTESEGASGGNVTNDQRSFGRIGIIIGARVPIARLRPPRRRTVRRSSR